MDVSPNALRKEIVATLKEVNMLLDQQMMGDEPFKPDDRGQLLLAKSECLNALVGLQGK